MMENQRENEPRMRRQIADADMIYGTQELKLPKEFIEENKATPEGPLIERPILIIFLLALAFVGIIAALVFYNQK
jgi:hypothetical protein